MTAIWAILAVIQSRFNVFGSMVGNGTQTNRKVTFLAKQNTTLYPPVYNNPFTTN